MENQNVKHLISYLETQLTETQGNLVSVESMYLNLSNHWKEIWGNEKGDGWEDVYTTLKEYEQRINILKFRVMWLQSQLSQIKQFM